MLNSVEGMDLKITINHSNDFFKNLTENFCTGCWPAAGEEKFVEIIVIHQV